MNIAELMQGATPITQASWVVDDIETATRGWIAMGVGPFFMYDIDLPQARYRGEVTPLQFTVSMAQAGPIQIELISQHSPGPSAFRDVVPAGTSGFHHVSRAFGNYDEAYARLTDLGIDIVSEFAVDGPRACYADTRPLIGCMFELVDDSEVGTWLTALVRESSIGWDGKDPIRRLPRNLVAE